MNKLIETSLILVIFGVIAYFGNLVGYEVLAIDAIPGMIVLILITVAGTTLARVVPGNMPDVGYIAIIGVIVSLNVFPGSEQVVAWTTQINILAIATPILAYAGISIGRNWADFTKMGWRALVVAMLVFLGTFLGSALIAEVVLRFQGII